MDLNEIMHFLKRAVSFKTRDAGTVTWASERPAPRGEPQGSMAPAVSGAARALGRPGPTHGEAAALVRPVLPSALRPVSLPSAFASQMLPRASTCLSGGRAPCRPAPRASESGASAPGG